MSRVYIPGEMSRYYQKLETYLRKELDKEVDEEFYRRMPQAPKRKLNWNVAADKPLAREWLRIRDELLGKKMNGVFLAQPPSVLQNKLPRCWAASLESWLQVVKKKRVPQDELISKFAKKDPPALDTDAELPTVCREYGMITKVILGQDFKRYAFLQNALRRGGHIWLLCGKPGIIAHAVVVYGIFIDPGNGWARLAVMDPAQVHSDPSLHFLSHYNLFLTFDLRLKL